MPASATSWPSATSIRGHAERAKNDEQHRQGQGRRLQGLPPGARAQRHRRGQHRHARPLARQDRHRGPEAGKHVFMPEAAHADAGREPADPQRLQEVQGPGVLHRHPAAERSRASSSARSTWCRRACWATSRRSPSGSTAGPRAARSPRPIRRRNSTGTCGWARHRKVDYIEQALPLPVPLVVRILGRQVHRLGRPPRRHRHLGHRAGPGRAWARSRSTAPTPTTRCPSRTATRPSTTATTRPTTTP